MKGIRGIIIDGFLVCYAAGCTAALAILMSDEIFKYVVPTSVFKWRAFVLISGAVAGALKGFRSTAFAHHLDEVKAKEPAADPYLDLR